MIQDSLFVLAGFILLFFGADGLVRGSVRLSLRSGISPLIIGLTVVAFGTSAPELFVSMQANLAGNGDIAVGNVIGSNIFNLAVILGLSAMISPIRIESQLIRQDIPVLIAATLLYITMSVNLNLSRLEGAVLFTGLVTYVVLTIHLARRGGEQRLTDEITEHLPARTGSIGRDLLWVAGGIALLVAGANLLVAGAVNLARAAGVSEAVIALTLIAGGTGLPELATSIVAALKKEADLAVGNIIGSNIFNLLCIGGLTALVKPISSPDIAATDLLTMGILTVLLLPTCWTGMRFGRRESTLFLAAYGVYLYLLWPHAT